MLALRSLFGKMFEAEDHSDTIQQLSLFQEENILLNGAIQDLRHLRLEEAKKAFHEYRDIYPNGESVDDKLKLSVFLLDGLAKVSGATFTEPGGIEAFLRREVLPYAPDAWYDPESVKTGYEISFTRYFYKPQLLRTLEEIRADILALERETEGLLNEILGTKGDLA